MSIDRTNADVNHQTSSHNEGQQNNTPPLKENDGQRNTQNHNQQMSRMMQDSEAQKAGRENESDNKDRSEKE